MSPPESPEVFLTAPHRREYARNYARAMRERIGREAVNARQRGYNRTRSEAEAPLRMAAKLAILEHREAMRAERRAERDRKRQARERDVVAKALGAALAKLRRRLEPKVPKVPAKRVLTPEQAAAKVEGTRRRRQAVRNAFIGPMPMSRRKLVEWYRKHPEHKPPTKARKCLGLRGRQAQTSVLPTFGPPRANHKPLLNIGLSASPLHRGKPTESVGLTAEERAGIRSKAKADRMAAKALAAKAFRKGFIGPPKPKDYRPPPKPRTEAQEAATAKRLQGIAARQDAVAAYRREVLRPAEVRRVPRVPASPEVPSAPRPVIDMAAIEALNRQTLERRRALMAATKHKPTTPNENPF